MTIQERAIESLLRAYEMLGGDVNALKNDGFSEGKFSQYNDSNEKLKELGL